MHTDGTTEQPGEMDTTQGPEPQPGDVQDAGKATEEPETDQPVDEDDGE